MSRPRRRSGPCSRRYPRTRPPGPGAASARAWRPTASAPPHPAQGCPAPRRCRPTAVSAFSAGRITSSLQLRTSFTSSQIAAARHGQRVLVQQPGLAQPLDHHRQATGIEELLHQVLARGHQVDDGRHVAAPVGPSRPASGRRPPGPRWPEGGSPHWSTRRWRALVRIAFSKASRVRMSDGFRSSFTICTMRRPVRCAITRRRDVHRRDRGIARKRHAQRLGHAGHGEAVPMVLQDPGLRLIDASASTNSSAVISPAFTASENFHRWVPDPTRSPRK